MAGQRFTHTIQRTPAANPETLVQYVAPTHQRVELISIDLGPLGASAATAPLVLDVVRQSTAGTASDDSAALVKLDPAAAENLLTTCRKTFTVEPTLTAVLFSITLHQQASRLWVPPSRIFIPGGGRVALRNITATFVDWKINVTLEE